MKKFFASSFCLLLISNSHLVATSPPETQSSHFFFNAELLYWTSYADEVVLTNHASNILQTDTFTDTAVLHPNFDWDVGYRFGFGYYFPDPVWSVDLYWTHFRTKASQYKFTDTDDINNTNGQMGMFPIWSLASDITAYDYVSNAVLHWKLLLNMIDLEFDYLFKYRDCFTLQPFMGLRSAWVYQNFNIDYSGGIFYEGILQPGISINGVDEIRMRNHYWGLGPRIGFAPTFFLPMGFAIYCEAAVSGLMGEVRVHQKETFIYTTRFNYHKDKFAFCWIGDFSAGLQETISLYNDQYKLTVKALYECQLLFHQMFLKRDSFGLVPNHPNLILQGVTFSANVAF